MRSGHIRGTRVGLCFHYRVLLGRSNLRRESFVNLGAELWTMLLSAIDPAMGHYSWAAGCTLRGYTDARKRPNGVRTLKITTVR